MKPHISVCIPVYQGASTLAATLRSVLASARADFEVVIRDNGSTDGTSDVIAGFDDPRIRLIRSEETLPLPVNWRATVEQARGELIKVVCADRRPSSLTRHCSVRLSPIAEDSPLLPPVGVWAVSQSQCGRSPSQAGY